MMFVDLEKRTIYGNDVWYVRSNHDIAIQALTGRRTIITNDFNALESLGFEFFCTECREPLTARAGIIDHATTAQGG